jgi:ABC-2 type transport system ATP-binding protein
MEEYAIRTEGLTRRFGDTTAVDSLSLSVAVGEIFGFLGHNGAGKTTTVRLLNGVLKPDSGELRVLGYDARTQGKELRAHTGVLTETPSLDERLSAMDNLTIYADLYGVPEGQVRQRANNVLEMFSLADRAGDKVGSYSKGMKQRLALARAFLHEPELIFLDEPTSGLDPVATQEVHQMIRHVSRDQGRTVFLCTHNLIEAQRLCNRIGVMENGRLVAVGTPLELAAQIGADMRYTLEIAPEQLETAVKALEVVQGVSDIHRIDDGLTFTVHNRETIPNVLAALLAAQVRVYAVTPHQTSVEDIYMSLHQRRREIL